MSEETSEKESFQNPNDNYGPSNIDHRPEIFKLNVDCLHAIFDWLSLNELISVANTCKRLHQAAGDYFRSNYVSTEIIGKHGHIYASYVNVDIFVQFIPRISLTCLTLKINHLIGDICKSLRHVQITGSLLEDRIEYIKDILNRVQTIDLVECPNREEIYEFFLKHCTSMTSLSVKRSYKILNKAVTIGCSNDWMLRKYPTLQHFELTDFYELQQNELKTFFKLNPNVQSFSIDSNSLWDNRKSILESGAMLHKLAIEFMNEELADRIIELLGELYEIGFYKRLHVYSSRIHRDYLEKLLSKPFSTTLEMLRARISDFNVPLFNLTVLSFPAYLHETFNKSHLCQNLPNLERVFFEEAKTDHIYPFICGSPKLRTIKVKRFQGGDHFVSGFFDLATFNKEREKLVENTGAKKIRLYVNNHFILSSKCYNQRLIYKFIELRQFDAFEWDELSSDYRNSHLSYY